MQSGKSSNKIRVGIIGLGDIGTVHLRGFLRERDAAVTAVCDADAAKIERSKKLFTPEQLKTLKTFADPRDLLAGDTVDAVVIGLPVYRHMPVANAALDAGKHIFLEKPIAVTISECDAFIKKAFATNLVVQVGLVYRYSNLYRAMGKMVEAGSFGKVMMAYCKEYRDSFPAHWFFYKDKSGGALMDKNCHHFDLFNWYIGSRPVRVFAMGGRHVHKGEGAKIQCIYSETPGAPIPNPTIVDHAFVITEYENGAKSNLGLCMYQIEPIEGLEIGIIGNNGSHALAKRDIALTAGGGPLGELAEVPVDYSSDNEDIGHIGLRVQHTEFLRTIRAGDIPYCNLFIARDCMVVCAAAELSIEENREVLISEFDDPEIEEIRAGQRVHLYRPTPDPLPPPEDYAPPQPGGMQTVLEILLKNLFQRADSTGVGIALLRFMLSDRAHPLRRAAFNSFLNAAAALINGNKNFQKNSRGLDSLLAIQLPGAAPLFVRIKDETIGFPERSTREPDMTLRLTDAGLRDLINGASLKRLFFEKKVLIEGNIPLFRLHTDLFSSTTS